MKTTIEISDAAGSEARRVAAQEGTTLRVLIEEGLRRVLADRRARQRTFRLRKATFKGRGLSPEFELEGWTAARDAIHGRRGA